MNQVSKVEHGQEVVLPADPMVTMIERVAMDPDLPMERLSALMDMRERQMDKEAEQVFNQAFAAAMADMPDVKRSGKNKGTSSSYSTLDDLIHATRPVLSQHGLSLNWQTKMADSVIEVTAIVRHSQGHSIQTTLSGPRDSGSHMNALQGGGSTETYLKRYSGFSILGLSSGDEVDNDGATEVKTISQEQFIELRDLILETGTDEVKFHKAHGAKFPEKATLHEFPVAKFEAAKAQLIRKKERPND